MKRSGISNVVATVLIVLMVIAMIVILWAIVLPLLEMDYISQDRSVSVSFEQGYTCYDPLKNVSRVQVVRAPSDAELSGLKVVFMEGGQSHDYYPGPLIPNSKRIYWFNISGEVDSVGVAPLFTVNGNEREGDILSFNSIIRCEISAIPTALGIEGCGDGKKTALEECEEDTLCANPGDVCISCLCCTPNTCGASDCGVLPDGCGGTIDCLSCATGTCVSGTCTTCGDGTCDAGESITSCSTDCCNAIVENNFEFTNLIKNNGDVWSDARDGLPESSVCIDASIFSNFVVNSPTDYIELTHPGLKLISLGGRLKIDFSGGAGLNVKADDITIENFEFFNVNENDKRFVVVDSGIGGTTIYNNVFHDCQKAMKLNSGSYDNNVSYNTIYNTSVDAMVAEGVVNSVISHNLFSYGITYAPSTAGVRYHMNGALYLDGSPEAVVECNLFERNSENNGMLPAGIGMAYYDAFNLTIVRNFFNDSIVYGGPTGAGSYNLGYAVGPIYMSNETMGSGNRPPGGIFVFDDNFCVAGSSHCTDRDGTTYPCCEFSPTPANYGNWQTMCGPVGAIGYTVP